MAYDCIDVSDLTSFPVRGCQSVSTCCSDEVLEARLAEAIDAIERITGQWICPREYCFKTKGNKSKNLFFPPAVIAPAIEIEYIKKDGVELDIEYDLDSHFLRTKDYCFRCCDYEVCGTFGYSTIPPSLKRAILILALEYAVPGITGYGKPFGMSRADWGDFSISYRLDEGMQSFGRSTGIREIDIIVQEFLNTAGMFNYMSSVCKDDCCNDCDSNTGC